MRLPEPTVQCALDILYIYNGYIYYIVRAYIKNSLPNTVARVGPSNVYSRDRYIAIAYKVYT